ncbi:MAG: sialate O-acetylesterase [Planctomycetota bacterium]|nr:MAG: sialate O-acetylesterase [Planctomycetota bacterium]
MRWTTGLLLGLVGWTASEAQAAVKLPSVFGSHMVLQRDQPVPVWGWADKGEEVTVSFRDQSVTVKAGEDGKWSTKLAPLAVGEPATLTIKGTNTIELTDVLVGEVWVCSGQSNMQWSVQAALDSDLEAAATGQSGIRLFQVPNVLAHEPQDDVKAEWRACTPENIPTFSAVAYFFGRQLHETLDVPVGIIQTAWGGTPAEAWTRHDHLDADDDFQPIIDTWADRAQNYNEAEVKAKHAEALEKWKVAVAKAKADGKQPPQRPRDPQAPKANPHYPCVLFNAMIAPLTPYAIKGAIWYQGESNAGRAHQYRELMPTMIKSWRDDWGQGDFPFYQVQLANFKEIKTEPGDSDWAELREAQTLAKLAIPAVDAACITDLGVAKDIHPKDKQNVAKRLARLALVDVYGMKTIVRNGPTYKSLTVQNGKALVDFDNGGRKLISYYNEPLSGFAIAGADKKWVWGTAKIVDEDTIEISHPEITEPVAVRYNWADNPQGNLYSDAYLPAYPFRSDDWAGITVGKLAP